MPMTTRCARRAAGTLVCVAIFLIVTTGVPATEIVLGGEAGLRGAVTVSPRIEERVEALLRARYTGMATVYGDILTLTAAATVWHERPADEGADDDSPKSPYGAELEELRLSLFPPGPLVYDIGRFRHMPGRALIGSPNDYYTTVSVERLLRGDFAEPGGPQTLLAARALGRVWYAGLVVMPVPDTPQLVAPGSIWLPAFPLDRTIDDPNLSDEPLTLEEVFAEPTVPIPEPYRRVSGGVEAGLTLGRFDLALLYYRGIDPNPVPRIRVSFPSVPLRAYNLSLAPQEVLIDSFGLVGETAAGAATFWVDTAFVPNHTLTTTEIDPFSKRSRLVVAPTIKAVAGAGYRIDAARLRLFAEYHHRHSFLPDAVPADTIVRTPLSSDLVLSARVSAGRRSTWTLSSGGILSFHDASAAAFVSALFESWSGVYAGLSAPLFIGGPDSDYGQYRDIAHVMMSVGLRF